MRVEFQYNDSPFLHPALFSLTCTHTASVGGFWKVDLEEFYNVQYVEIYNREDCCSGRLDGVKVRTMLMFLIWVVWAFTFVKGVL